MHWISLILSFFFGKLNSRSHSPSLKETVFAVFEEITYKSRKPVTLLLGALACVLILCGGFFMSILDLTTQYDREGLLRFTASFATGVFLVALSIAVFVYIFKFAWPGAREQREVHKETPVQAAGALEQALATLVMDFVKEREQRREVRERRREAAPTQRNEVRPAPETGESYRH